jgi:hypothetical protein
MVHVNHHCIRSIRVLSAGARHGSGTTVAKTNGIASIEAISVAVFCPSIA